MSNYTKSTNFATKDDLAAGNALKRVKGAEIDDEFNSIATAIATKANSNNTVMTGVPVAPTAAANTNSTQVATTAYTVTAIAAIPSITAAVVNEVAYPVGSIYTAVVSTNPATLLGVGTWSAFGSGRVLLGHGGSYSAGDEGGATTDSHAITVAEMPTHNHGYTGTYGDSDADGGGDRSSSVGAYNSHPLVTKLENQGSGAAHEHDIMQPYIVVYMWQRTA
jgi:hypothetical protein